MRDEGSRDGKLESPVAEDPILRPPAPAAINNRGHTGTSVAVEPGQEAAMSRKKRRTPPMPDALEVDRAVRAAEGAVDERHVHAEPRDGFWEILGDVRDEETRERVFEDIRERLGEKAVVNSIRIAEPPEKR